MPGPSPLATPSQAAALANLVSPTSLDGSRPGSSASLPSPNLPQATAAISVLPEGILSQPVQSAVLSPSISTLPPPLQTGMPPMSPVMGAFAQTLSNPLNMDEYKLKDIVRKQM